MSFGKQYLTIIILNAPAANGVVANPPPITTMLGMQQTPYLLAMLNLSAQAWRVNFSLFHNT